MSFHPDKCNVLRVSRAKNPVMFNYSLKEQNLEAVNTAKYLGIDLSNNLTWNSHIDRSVKKANNMENNNRRRRNLRVSNSDTKAAAYKNIVRSNLEYCALTWSPYTTSGKHKLEMVQRLAARYVTNHYHNTSSVTEMLLELDWESLESRRVKIQLTLLYKIINDLVDIPASAYLTPTITKTRANHTKNYRQFPSKGDASSHVLSQLGMFYQPIWLRLLTWKPSSRSFPLLSFKFGRASL